MKNRTLLHIGLTLSVSIISCGSSNKDKAKLTNSWVVQNAKIYSPDIRAIKDWDKDSLGIIIRAMENAYKGQAYDLRSDGKFSTTGNLKTASGTWNEKDGVVEFTTYDYKQAFWDLKDKKVSIGHDSSLIVDVRLGIDSSFVRLTLKPAPGQAVKTDN